MFSKTVKVQNLQCGCRLIIKRNPSTVANLLSRYKLFQTMNTSQWRFLAVLKDYLNKVANDNPSIVSLNKEITNILQKAQQQYASLETKNVISTVSVKPVPETNKTTTTNGKVNVTAIQNDIKATKEPEKSGYGLPDMLANLASKLSSNAVDAVATKKEDDGVPKWKLKYKSQNYSKMKDGLVFPVNISVSDRRFYELGIASRTSQTISLITTAKSDMSLRKRVDDLSAHLQQFPEAKNQAVRQGAQRLLLRVRDQTKDVEVHGAIREALTRLGYTDAVPKKGIRILSIDGGGIRGVVVIKMLKKLEELTGMKVYDMFDYVCGVSTGALLTAALVAKKTPLDVALTKYKELSQKVFSQNAFYGSTSLVWNHSYYDTELWEKLLQEYVGDLALIKTSRDPRCPKFSAVSVVVNQSQTTPYLFRNYSLPFRVQSAYIGSCDSSIWQAVRASAAAPTYFEEYMLNDLLHQDGGIMVNNPTAIAMHEAKLLWPNTEIQCVVSFGTGRTHPIVYDHNPEASKLSASSWRDKFMKILDSATDTEGVHMMLNDLLPPNVYYRFNPYLTEMLSIAEIRAEKIAQLEQDAKMYLRRNEEKFERAAHALLQRKPAQQVVNDWLEKQKIMLNLKGYPL